MSVTHWRRSGWQRRQKIGGGGGVAVAYPGTSGSIVEVLPVATDD